MCPYRGNLPEYPQSCALGKGLIKLSRSLWDLTPLLGPASVTANHYMEVKFSSDKDLSWHQRQVSYMNLALDAKALTELGAKFLVLRMGCSLQEYAWKPKAMKQTLYRLDQLMHGGGKAELGIQRRVLQDSLCKLLGWGTESPAHNLPALQEGGKRCGLQAHCSWSCYSHVKWVSSILPSPTACQKHSDPKGFSFHGKCWNLGFIPIWKAGRFCKIKILHKIKWLFTAQLYRLTQTASYQKQPPEWVLQSEFPGLSLSRAQLAAKPMLTVLQKGTETKQIRHSISKRAHRLHLSFSLCLVWWNHCGSLCHTLPWHKHWELLLSGLKCSCCSQQHYNYFSLHMLWLSSELLNCFALSFWEVCNILPCAISQKARKTLAGLFPVCSLTLITLFSPVKTSNLKRRRNMNWGWSTWRKNASPVFAQQ